MNASIRIRLTTLFTVVLAVTLLIFSSILFHVFNKSNNAEFDIALYNHALDVSETINIDFFGTLIFHNDSTLATEKIIPFPLGRAFMQVVSPKGVIAARSANLEQLHLPVLSEDWESVFRNGSAFRTLSAKEMASLHSAISKSNYRMITLLTKRNQEPAFILQIAVPTTLLDQERNGLILLFLIGIPVTLIFAFVGGLYLSGMALQPVRNIIAKAEKLNPSNLSERLPVSSVKDELQQLTITLNEMLARIQSTFESHEHFIADASHQLKTPIAILRGELDVFRNKPRTPEEMNTFLESASQELQYLSRLLEDLLLLAQTEAGASALAQRELRLDEVLLESVARMELLARKKNISIRFDMKDAGDSSYTTNGDADLLQSMFRNLVENAVKYSPENSSVEVSLSEESTEFICSIKDFGDPISPEVEKKIFDRHYRGNTVKDHTTGSGLGLTIARRIAEMHGGNIELSQGNSLGKSFIVRIKKI